MLFRFIGQYTGKRTQVDIDGVTFVGHDPVEVVDPSNRLVNHPEVEAVLNAAPEATPVDGVIVDMPRKRGRPRK